MLREELQHLQEQGSYVGEVVKPMDKKKVSLQIQNLFRYFCELLIDVMSSTVKFDDDHESVNAPIMFLCVSMSSAWRSLVAFQNMFVL